MNRKMNLVLVLFAAFIGIVMTTGCTKKAGAQSAATTQRPERNADGEYPIGPQVQVYDDDFKPIDKKEVYFTYQPTNLENNGVCAMTMRSF